MALIRCPEPKCGNMISTSALACPRCGCNVQLLLRQAQEWEERWEERKNRIIRKVYEQLHIV